MHAHEHTHDGEHAHVHESESSSITPWVLFVIFVLGPCEPLIPLLMFPAASRGCLSWLACSHTGRAGSRYYCETGQIGHGG